MKERSWESAVRNVYWIITVVFTISYSTAVIYVTALFITAVYIISCSNAAENNTAWIITATQVTVGLLGPLL